MTYKAHYDAFHNHANYAARVFQYYESIEKSNTRQLREHIALNRSARFWLDWRYMALKTVIITLAKIFDKQRNSHSKQRDSHKMRAMLEELPLEFYSTKQLIARRIADGMTDKKLLESVASRSHDLNAKDVARIEAQMIKAEKLWEIFEPLRNRFYAHDQMTPQEKRDYFSKARYADLRRLIQILLNIAFQLEQSELNGSKPDFRRNYSGTFNKAAKEADQLLSTLVDGVP